MLEDLYGLVPSVTVRVDELVNRIVSATDVLFVHRGDGPVDVIKWYLCVNALAYLESCSQS